MQAVHCGHKTYAGNVCVSLRARVLLRDCHKRASHFLEPRTKRRGYCTPPPAAEAGGELRIGSGSEDDGSWESGARTGEESERTIGRLYRHEKSLSRVKITWPFLEEVGHTNAIRLERTQNQCLG